VLDAQNFGVAQRRRRVFVVGHLGDWKPAAEVLFESESLRGDIKKGRKEGQEPAKCLTTRIRNDYETETFIAFENSRRDTLRFFDNVSNTLQAAAGSGGGNVPCVSYALQGAGSTSQNANGSGYKEEQSFTLNVTDVHGVAFGWQNSASQGMSVDTISPTLDKSKTPAAMQNMAVRRLTPVECERLQGFPDNYTNIPKAVDGNRYKALGNSMAVPVMRWIGERINQYEQRGVA
jgi:DNA (cytosine-5)-methyltransferase 1